MKVTLESPDLLDVDQKYVNEALIAILYCQGKPSQSQACQILDINCRNIWTIY